MKPLSEELFGAEHAASIGPLEHAIEGEAMVNKGDGWTLWKEILGTCIAILPFAVLFFAWMANVQTRLTVLEENRSAQAYRDSAQNSQLGAAVLRMEAAQLEIKRNLEDINKFLRDNRIRQ